MQELTLTLLQCALLSYVAGCAGSLVFFRKPAVSAGAGFGCAALGGVFGMAGSIAGLTNPFASASHELFTSLLPNVQFTIRADPLSLFFVLIVSTLALS